MHSKSNKISNIANPRARFDYDLKDEYIAGVMLTGAETKSLRMSRASLKGSFISLKQREVLINNLQIMPTSFNALVLDEQMSTRARKLLLKNKQIDELLKAKEQGLAIVPLKILTSGRYIKIIIATAKGKKAYDKRSTIKTRDTEREIRRKLKRI